MLISGNNNNKFLSGPTPWASQQGWPVVELTRFTGSVHKETKSSIWRNTKIHSLETLPLQMSRKTEMKVCRRVAGCKLTDLRPPTEPNSKP